MSKPDFQDHFGSLAPGYAAFRPSYPDSVFQALLEYSEGARDVAVDVGAGTGQATLPLAKHFGKVIGVEPSEGQFSNITAQAPNIELRLAAAEQVDSVLPPSSADLLVVAQAIHWFRLEEFWPAVHKVLKPGGTLAYWGYGTTTLHGSENDKEANEIFSDFYENTLGLEYWPSNRRHIDDKYAKIVPPSSFFEKITRKEDLTIDQEVSMDSFMGYLNTWSGLKKYREAHKGSTKPDPLVPLRARLEKSFAGRKVRTIFPIFMILAKKRLV